MKVEIFYAPGCPACVAQQDELRVAAQEVAKDLDWRAVNVVEHVDEAVKHGVLSLPSIVIDGELVFTSMPKPAQMQKAIAQRQGKHT